MEKPHQNTSVLSPVSLRKVLNFSSYGEAIFMAIQTVLIAFLVLHFEDKKAAAMGYLGVYVAAMSFLLSPAAPDQLLSALQASNVFFIVISKVGMSLSVMQFNFRM